MEGAIAVGLGELAISARPESVLAAFGLGSCVALIAFDSTRKIGGLLHALLPMHRNGDRNPTKFVDTVMIEMLAQLSALGVRPKQLDWWIVGGAQMLTAPGLSDRFNIGAQNIAMAQAAVERHQLRLVGQDTGGYQGRTVRLFVADGSVVVRYVNGQQSVLPNPVGS